MVGPAVPGVVETELDGDIALFHPATGRVVILNGTASDVWRLSDGEHTVRSLVAHLARAYGVDDDSIRADVEAALSELRTNGFLTATDE